MLILLGIICMLLGVSNIIVGKFCDNIFNYIIGGWCLAVGAFDIIVYLNGWM